MFLCSFGNASVDFNQNRSHRIRCMHGQEDIVRISMYLVHIVDFPGIKFFLSTPSLSFGHLGFAPRWRHKVCVRHSFFDGNEAASWSYTIRLQREGISLGKRPIYERVA